MNRYTFYFRIKGREMRFRIPAPDRQFAQKEFEKNYGKGIRAAILCVRNAPAEIHQ